DILSSLNVATQAPLDAKTYFLTLAERQDLGTNNVKAFSYYQDMRVICIETHKEYIWRVIRNGISEVGILSTAFTYPTGATSNGISYGRKSYNFFEIGDTDGGGGGGFNNGKGTFTWLKYAEDAEGLN